jgi:hypothetical protein
MLMLTYAIPTKPLLGAFWSESNGGAAARGSGGGGSGDSNSSHSPGKMMAP